MLNGPNQGLNSGLFAPGYRVRNPEAYLYIAALEDYGKFIVDSNTRNAIDEFFRDIKGSGWIEYLYVLYLFLGTTSASQGINALNPGTNNISFSGTNSFLTTGYKGNGSTGYGDLGFAASQLPYGQSAHIAVYINNYGTIGSPVFGSRTSVDLRQFLFQYYNLGVAFDSYNSASGRLSYNATLNTTGFYMGNRVAANYCSVVYNQSVLSSISTSGGDILEQTRNIYIGAYNNIGTPGSLYNATHSYLSVGKGIPISIEKQGYYAIEKFLKRLDRA